MSTPGLLQILMVYTWVLAAIIIFFMLLIGRFFEKTAQQRTHYMLFLIPLALFLGGMLRQVSTEHIANDALGGLLWFIGAVFLIVLCVNLYRQMTQN